MAQTAFTPADARPTLDAATILRAVHDGEADPAGRLDELADAAETLWREGHDHDVLVLQAVNATVSAIGRAGRAGTLVAGEWSRARALLCFLQARSLLRLGYPRRALETAYATLFWLTGPQRAGEAAPPDELAAALAAVYAEALVAARLDPATERRCAAIGRPLVTACAAAARRRTADLRSRELAVTWATLLRRTANPADAPLIADLEAIARRRPSSGDEPRIPAPGPVAPWSFPAGAPAPGTLAA